MSETHVVARLPERRPRVGIVMMSAVGDAVHVLPVVNALKRARPGAHDHVGPAARARRRSCADTGAVDEIVDVRPFDAGWRAFADVRRELATRPFDLVHRAAGLLQGRASSRRSRARR